jgi:hypothetical protein
LDVKGDVFGPVVRLSTAADREPKLIVRSLESLRNSFLWYCQLNSRRNKNKEADKMNRRSSSGQLTIGWTQITSSHMANLDFITAR